MNRRLASLGVLLGCTSLAAAGYPVTVQPPVQQAQYPQPPAARGMNQSLAGAIQSALSTAPAADAPPVMSSTPSWGAMGAPRYSTAGGAATAPCGPAGCPATGACPTGGCEAGDRGSCLDRMKAWLFWHEKDYSNARPRPSPYQAPLRTYFVCRPPIGFGWGDAGGRPVGGQGCATGGCAPATGIASSAQPRVLSVPLSTEPQENPYPPRASRPLATQLTSFFTPKWGGRDEPTTDVPAPGVSPTKPFTRQ